MDENQQSNDERSESPSILQPSPDNEAIQDDNVFLDQSGSVNEPYSENALFNIQSTFTEDSSDAPQNARHTVEREQQPTSSQSNDVPDLISSRGVAPEEDSCSSEAQNTDSVDEPPAKLRRINSPVNEVDGETCPICLDSWGNSGEHRLVALKCGHLFGSQCVERWLRAQNSKDRTCPTCKSKASLKDIRCIYARRLVAADTTQITELQKQVEILQSEKNRTELELQKSKIAHRACVMQLEVLRSTLLKQQGSNDQPLRKTWRFALEKNLEICKDGGCRVATYNCRTYELYVSQKSTNNLFPGYGIRKINCIDYKLGQFVHLHPKAIRDMTYSQPRDLLLSVGLDNSVRVVERGLPTATIQCGVPLWSVSWDYLRSNEFYVGGVGGVIHQYDIRNPGSYIQRLTPPGDLSPVVSLCSTEYGLLSCQLNSCWLWVAQRRCWEPRSLPVDGPFMSLCYDNDSHRAIVACRPVGNEKSKLTVCKLKSSPSSGEVLFDVERTLLGSSRSTVMSRSAWVKATGATWVASHSESESCLNLHGLDGARTISLPAAEPALDVYATQINGDTLLAALSDSRLRIYKALSTNY
ncbi:E3 ubiquitin-protein ligase RFWD3-like [Aricia agestis]|uniref:E3 ubiquitin-protein ligase RFWD3-like n=1 Tax=Aricia agestis TaxID=91739 RepID=UPI001C20B6E1|nr:E3 ubiquitin-protein ligase RFWD3-like [Aricia agestis]XP_041983922.1 E3 ubiquitin-protein ligase RFWD3-like [Aricia agestis]